MNINAILLVTKLIPHAISAINAVKVIKSDRSGPEKLDAATELAIQGVITAELMIDKELLDEALVKQAVKTQISATYELLKVIDSFKGRR